MALGFNYSSGEGSGEIMAIVKYDARSGRMSRRDYENNENTLVDITRSFKAVFDLENIEVGTINFSTGGAPSFAVGRYGGAIPAVPDALHKPGFRIVIKLGKDCGGDIREFASTAKACMRGVDDLHTAYMEGVKANPGKLPVVILKDTVPVTTGEGQKKSTNYSPIFEIVSWVARPADLVFSPKAPLAAQAQAAAPVQSNSPPSTGSTRVAPPPAAAPAASTHDDSEDFG